MEHNKELEQIKEELNDKYEYKKQALIKMLQNNTAEYALAWGTEGLVFAEILAEQARIVISKLLKLDSVEEQIEFCKTWRENATRDLLNALRATSQHSSQMHNIMQAVRFCVRGSFLAPGEQYSLTHIENVLEKALQGKQKGVL